MDDKPLSPDNRNFSPKEALIHKRQRGLSESPSQKLSKTSRNSIGFIDHGKFMAPSHSVMKIRPAKIGLWATNILAGLGPIDYDTGYRHNNQRYKNVDPEHYARIQEGKSVQALKRLEDYERRNSKIVKKIKKKVADIHKAMLESPEGDNDPVKFNNKCDNQVHDVFRDTRYNQRRNDRLLKWRDKKYQKFHNAVKDYSMHSKRLLE